MSDIETKADLSAPLAKPSPIQGRATVTPAGVGKPHVSKSTWTIDKETKTASTDYLGGKLTISRRDNNILYGKFIRLFTEEEGANKTAEIDMHFSMGHIDTVLEAQDHAEANVRENLGRIYPQVLAVEDEKIRTARLAEAGAEPF